MASDRKPPAGFANILKQAESNNIIPPILVVHMQAYLDFIICDEKPKFKRRTEYIQALATKLFVSHMDTIFPKNRFSCKPEENFEWPIPLYPSEAFSPKCVPGEKSRAANFYEFLKVGDVLDCKVFRIKQIGIRLIVVHKLGYTRILEDLNIKMTLPLNKRELAFLDGQELAKKDLLRVAVSNVIPVAENSKVIAKLTLDENVLRDPNNSIKLGKILDKDLPIYIRDPHAVDKYETMKDYLDSQMGFNHPKYFNDALECFGVDSKRMFSFTKPAADNDECFERMSIKQKELEDQYQKFKKEQTIIKAHKQYEKVNVPTSEEALYDFAMAYKLDKDNRKNKKQLDMIKRLFANK